jgi:hypothetical protein
MNCENKYEEWWCEVKTIKSVDGDGVPVSFGLYRCNLAK